MSYFVTGKAQRRGSRSSTQGTSFGHGRATPYPSSDILRQPAGPTRAPIKRRRTVSIGADNATGLVIQGTHEIDEMEGTDPDNATPPISGYTLSNPDFPISYTGRGTLKFVSPVRIATIDGPLNVNGEVYSNSGLLNGTFTDVISWTSTIELGATGAGENFTKNEAETYATYMQTRDEISLHVHFTWSDKGSVAGSSPIFIKNLPFTVESQVHKTVVHSTGIIPTQLGSYFVVKASEDATELELFSSDAATATEVAVTADKCSATGELSFIFTYHAVIP